MPATYDLSQEAKKLVEQLLKDKKIETDIVAQITPKEGESLSVYLFPLGDMLRKVQFAARGRFAELNKSGFDSSSAESDKSVEEFYFICLIELLAQAKIDLNKLKDFFNKAVQHTGIYLTDIKNLHTFVSIALLVAKHQSLKQADVSNIKILEQNLKELEQAWQHKFKTKNMHFAWPPANIQADYLKNYIEKESLGSSQPFVANSINEEIHTPVKTDHKKQSVHRSITAKFAAAFKYFPSPIKSKNSAIELGDLKETKAPENTKVVSLKKQAQLLVSRLNSDTLDQLKRDLAEKQKIIELIKDPEAALVILRAKKLTHLEQGIFTAKEIAEILIQHSNDNNFTNKVFNKRLLSLTDKLLGTNIDLMCLAKKDINAAVELAGLRHCLNKNIMKKIAEHYAQDEFFIEAASKIDINDIKKVNFAKMVAEHTDSPNAAYFLFKYYEHVLANSRFSSANAEAEVQLLQYPYLERAAKSEFPDAMLEWARVCSSTENKKYYKPHIALHNFTKLVFYLEGRFKTGQVSEVAKALLSKTKALLAELKKEKGDNYLFSKIDNSLAELDKTKDNTLVAQRQSKINIR